jgi:hypothetical protein
VRAVKTSGTLLSAPCGSLEDNYVRRSLRLWITL